MTIEVSNITKTFSTFRALNDVSLKVNSGELVALLGPSGSGKTTLLRIIAGMEMPDCGSGPVTFDGVDVSGLDPGKRRIGFVFQHYALFKHMTVFENIAFGLRSRPWRLRPKASEIRARVEELLALIQLQNLAPRYPAQLSGGQRQRVALARALAVQPRVLLLDEPFGALDATVRRELRRWLRKLHDTIHVTTLFVTHDQEEALEVSDRIAVMNAGQIEQIGSPREVYESPANPFVFKFLGNYNLFHRRNGEQSVPENATLVRPHDIELYRENPGGHRIPARIIHIGYAGSIVNVELRRLDTDQLVDATISLASFHQLELVRDELIFLDLRAMHEFPIDYVI